jgi:glycosyltransferase involved in cell wall biosynthesis
VLNPDFSIVTPTFRQLDWLRLCIASVRDQVVAMRSSVRAEHIIQDAGTPGIEELARELGAEFYRDGQIIFHAKECSLGLPTEILQSATNQAPNYSLKIFSEKDAGMYDAVNRGLARANGYIFAYLNSDDQYLPGTLEEVWKFLQTNTLIDVLFGDVIVVDADGDYLCTRMATIPSEYHTCVHTLSIFTAATFFRRSLVADKKILFQSEWKAVGDVVWILDLLRAKIPMGLLQKTIAAATETGRNLILSAESRSEAERLFFSSPWFLRIIKPLLVLQHRFKRIVRGAYWPPLETYLIYTRNLSEQRTIFRPLKSTYKLQGRFG